MQPRVSSPPAGRKPMLLDQRLAIAGALTAGFSLALIVFMTLGWFEATAVKTPAETVVLTPEIRSQVEQSEGPGFDFTANAWQSFSGFDFLFLLVALAGVAFGISLLLTRSPIVAVLGGLVFGLAALIVAIVILLKVVSPPDLIGFLAHQTRDQSADAGASADASVQLGAVAALIAALGCVAGSAFALVAARPRPA